MLIEHVRHDEFYTEVHITDDAGERCEVEITLEGLLRADPCGVLTLTAGSLRELAALIDRTMGQG